MSSCSTAHRTTPTRGATTSPMCRPRTRCRSSRSPPTPMTRSTAARRRRRQCVAQIGDEQLPRQRLRLHATQGPGGELVPAQLAQCAQNGSVHRPIRVQRRWSDLQEQDVFHVQRRALSGGHAGAAPLRRADAGDEERRLLRAGGRAGAVDHDLRPGDRTRCQRRLDAGSVSEQHHPRPPHQPGGPGDRAVFPGSESHDGWRGAVAGQPGFFRALQQGRVLELGRESRSQLQSERSRLLPLGRERAQRDPEHERHPDRSSAGRAVAADSRQPRHRRRLGPHLRLEHRAEPPQQLHVLPRAESL